MLVASQPTSSCCQSFHRTQALSLPPQQNFFSTCSHPLLVSSWLPYNFPLWCRRLRGNEKGLSHGHVFLLEPRAVTNQSRMPALQRSLDSQMSPCLLPQLTLTEIGGTALSIPTSLLADFSLLSLAGSCVLISNFSFPQCFELANSPCWF